MIHTVYFIHSLIHSSGVTALFWPGVERILGTLGVRNSGWNASARTHRKFSMANTPIDMFFRDVRKLENLEESHRDTTRTQTRTQAEDQTLDPGTVRQQHSTLPNHYYVIYFIHFSYTANILIYSSVKKF